MTHRAFPIALAALLLLAAGGVAYAQQPAVFHDTDFDLSMTPPGFMVQKRSKERMDPFYMHVEYQSPPDELNFRPTLRLLSTPHKYTDLKRLKQTLFDSQLNWEHDIAEELGDMRRYDTVVHMREPEIREEQGYVEVIFDAEYEAQDLTVFAALRFGEGKLFVMKCYENCDNFPDHLDDYRAAAASLKLPRAIFNIDLTQWSKGQKIVLLFVIFGVIIALRVLVGRDEESNVPAAVRIAQQREKLHEDIFQRGKESVGEESNSFSGGYKARSAPPPTIPKLGGAPPSPPKTHRPPDTPQSGDGPDTLFPGA